MANCYDSFVNVFNILKNNLGTCIGLIDWCLPLLAYNLQSLLYICQPLYISNLQFKNMIPYIWRISFVSPSHLCSTTLINS